MMPAEFLDACDHIKQEAHDQNGVAVPGVCRLCTGKALEAQRDLLEKKIRLVLSERNAFEKKLLQARAELNNVPKRVRRGDARIGEAVQIAVQVGRAACAKAALQLGAKQVAAAIRAREP